MTTGAPNDDDARDRPDPGRAHGARRARGLLADVPGVAEAYSVTGEWDFAAILRLREQDELAHVVTGAGLGQLPGITRTQTLVAFEVYRSTTSRRSSRWAK